MNKIIAQSILVYPGMEFCWETDEYRCRYDISEVAQKNEHCYSIHNAVIAFVVDGKMYVMIYDASRLDVLRYYGFREREFFVPFSHKDYPADERYKEKWKTERAAAEAAITWRH
ncbi:hypothetical protein IJF93_00510 [Candidatus Saccharibacteria bacterium]|nr:hypothetical protein [Candidatus Saccharibacteria bacterium]